MLSEKVNTFEGEENPRDELVWSNFKNGDRRAFAFIYNNYVDFLYNYGRHIVGDETLVEDAIQELFVNLWNSKSHLSEVHSIKTYLFKSLRRALLKKLKKLRKIRPEAFLWDDRNYGMTESIQEVIIRQQEEQEKIRFVRETLDHFTGRQKEILYLKFYQSLGYEEISRVLELDIKYVYNTASKAYKNLRSQLAIVMK